MLSFRRVDLMISLKVRKLPREYILGTFLSENMKILHVVVKPVKIFKNVNGNDPLYECLTL